MPEEYTQLVEALKGLEVPFAENAWVTRPNRESYGVVSLEFEAGNQGGDGLKQDTAWEGSVDLFSRDKNGEGYPEEIGSVLKEICGASWEMNHHAWERETGLFHWEWVFQIFGD